MAKVSETNLHNWGDGETFHGPDYNNERTLIVRALNDADTRIDNLFKAPVVTTLMLLDNAVTAPKIQDSAVVRSKIALGAVGANEIAPGSIVTTAFQAQAVDTNALQNGAVTTAKIADKQVTDIKLGDASVGTTQLKIGSVTTPKISLGAITTDKLFDGSVTNAKLADGAVNNRALQDSSVSGSKLSVGAVESDKIFSGAVTTDKLANLSVTTEKIVDASVSSAKLADGSVTPTKVTKDAITQYSYDMATTDQRIADAFSDGIPPEVLQNLSDQITGGIDYTYAGKITKLSDNMLAPSEGLSYYPVEGITIFLVNDVGGTNGTAWKTASGATVSTTGIVRTEIANGQAYQEFREVNTTGTNNAASNSVYKRVWNSNLLAWMPFEKVLEQSDYDTLNTTLNGAFKNKGQVTSTTDFNTYNSINSLGEYYIFASSANTSVPAPSVGWLIKVFAATSSWAEQEAISTTTGDRYHRHYNVSNGWSAWRRILDINDYNLFNERTGDVLNMATSGLQSSGKYSTVTYTRADATKHTQSVGSNPDANGNFQTVTVTYYGTNGTTVLSVYTYTVAYDANGQITSRTVVKTQ